MKKAYLWSVTDTFTLIHLACFYQLTVEEYNNLSDSSKRQYYVKSNLNATKFCNYAEKLLTKKSLKTHHIRSRPTKGSIRACIMTIKDELLQ